LVPPIELPAQLIERFRALSFERLERIDAAWLAVTHGTGALEVEQDLHRDLHTLKGDARVVGFADVGLLCQRLEDLVVAARERGYRVHEDVDIVVTMALQFIGMLLRKKAGASRGGIDLDGFLRQIQDTMSERLQEPADSPDQEPSSHVQRRVLDPQFRLSAPTRERLSVAATTVYLESLDAVGASRERLRAVWKTLSREVGDLELVALIPVVARHAAAASELARELGKSVDVSLDVADARVSVEVLDTLNTALLHAVRNAVDHGIEPVATRQARGKPQLASIAIRARARDDALVLSVEDDGGGIDFEQVRARAKLQGILSPEAAEVAPESELIELLFRPGFSTREVVSDVSGRGIGLDALRASVVALGGTVTLEPRPNVGTTLNLRLPNARSRVDVHVFPAARAGVLLAVSTTWSALLERGAMHDALDPLKLLDLPDSPALPDPIPAPATLRMRRGGLELALLAGGPQRTGSASRLCPTPRGSPAEIVEFEGSEAILMRLEVLVPAR
jgi:two-component system, chemotaxis family, sensor kinase CheA